MNCILLYGPPAVGKLTIARELSKITDYPIFHNHVTRDLVKDIYGDNLNNHYDLVNGLRNQTLAYCASAGTNLIVTFVYDGPEDDETVRSFITSIEPNGGNIHFVRITAPAEILHERIANESRKQHQKLTDSGKLRELLETYEYQAIPFVESIEIDSSQQDAASSAAIISRQLSL